MSFLQPALLPEHQRLRQQLRQQLKSARRSLTPTQQRIAARGLQHQLQRLIKRSNIKIAAYDANGGEISAHLFLKPKQQVYYPVLQPLHAQGVIFRQPAGNSRWRRNRWGISEPSKGRQQPAWTFDVLLMPLVGFTLSGHRLGMGGGYYDRLLASFRHRPRKPLLIGLAHDCQQLTELPLAAWDQPIEFIATGTRLINANAT
ncbi:MAG: 5-formyltetrahydrofolate cyclo-ligase [Moraxellaceae bacterium]|nr:5-formyltetrahydrofolate cyclo-ligase [Moraxellaceae bacterium]